jgi:hypothetical protein
MDTIHAAIESNQKHAAIESNQKQKGERKS